MKYEVDVKSANLNAEPLTWLKEFADKLCDHACKPNGQSGHYVNEDGRRGFYICYKFFGLKSDRYLMISRSHTDYKLTKQQIASELRSNEIEVRTEWYGKYHLHLFVPGTYVTVRYGNLWYMLSESGIPEPYQKWRITGFRGNSYRNAGRINDFR
jgi:hypothetical protein